MYLKNYIYYIYFFVYFLFVQGHIKVFLYRVFLYWVVTILIIIHLCLCLLLMCPLPFFCNIYVAFLSLRYFYQPKKITPLHLLHVFRLSEKMDRCDIALNNQSNIFCFKKNFFSLHLFKACFSKAVKKVINITFFFAAI